jgi:hypothetical protein
VATSTSWLRIGLAAVLALAGGAQAAAQERAGVVTTLHGDVTVLRASLPRPTPLRFKDAVLVRDRIATGQDSLVRVLLGDRAVVTLREHSVVTITEAPGRSTVEVAAGRAAVAVARERMRTGDLVEVKTPTAVAGIRGTVVVAEVLDADHSVITVLKGVVDVKGLGAGRVVGPPRVVRALQRVTVARGGPVPPPQALTPDAARHLGQEFRAAPPPVTPGAATAAVNAAEVHRAARDIARFTGLTAPGAGLGRGASARDAGASDAGAAVVSRGHATAAAVKAVREALEGDERRGRGPRNRERGR